MVFKKVENGNSNFNIDIDDIPALSDIEGIENEYMELLALVNSQFYLD